MDKYLSMAAKRFYDYNKVRRAGMNIQEEFGVFCVDDRDGREICADLGFSSRIKLMVRGLRTGNYDNPRIEYWQNYKTDEPIPDVVDGVLIRCFVDPNSEDLEVKCQVYESRSILETGPVYGMGYYRVSEDFLKDSSNYFGER